MEGAEGIFLPELHVQRRLRPVPLRNLGRWEGRFGELSVSSTELSSPVEDTPNEDLEVVIFKVLVTRHDLHDWFLFG